MWRIDERHLFFITCPKPKLDERCEEGTGNNTQHGMTTGAGSPDDAG